MAARLGRLVHVAGEEPLGAVGVPHEIPLQQDTWIGRVQANDRHQAVIAKPYVSGTHCRIWQEHGQVFLSDLSSNGTFVNGEMVGKGRDVQINHGDTIAFVFKKMQKIVYEVNLPQPAVVVDDAPQEALVAQLRQEIAELRAKLEATEQSKRQLNAEAESTATLQRQVQLLQEIRDTNEACIADLTNKLETERRESRALQRTVQRDEAEVAALTKQVEEMRNKIRQQVEQMAQLQAELTAAQEAELSAKSALELSRSEVKRLTEDATYLDELNTKCESLRGELERKTGEMQSTKVMLETTSAALQEERAAHAETKQLLAEAQEQLARLSRQHQEAEALAKARADQLKELSSQLQSTTSTNSRSRAVIDSLEQERAALLRGITAVQTHDRQRVTTCQRTVDGMLEMLVRLTESVRSFGDNLATDFAPLEFEDMVDNSCTQNEPASPTPRMRNGDETVGHTQSSDEGTPARHPVTPLGGKAVAAAAASSQSVESQEPLQLSDSSSQLQQSQRPLLSQSQPRSQRRGASQQAPRSPPPKRAMAFDSSSDGEDDTAAQSTQAAKASSPPQNAAKRARRTRSQTQQSKALSQTQQQAEEEEGAEEDFELQLQQRASQQEQQEQQEQQQEDCAQESGKHSMPPPQTSSDYDVTQLPASPRTTRRVTRQWPLDSVDSSELPNISNLISNSNSNSNSNQSSGRVASRQTQSGDKQARASSSSHIPSEWDVPDLSFSTNAPVASASRQAQTFDGTQPGASTFRGTIDDAGFEDLT